MRKFLMALLLVFSSTLSLVHANNLTHKGIFASLGATVSTDTGGAIESQTRSIYSGGGGMASFRGKRVTLIAADAPSFSAGCSGISWHFGGFSFISVDELKELVQAISRSALGIALDLAMQTLCPQCYAVMKELRAMANAMRNASADACRLAQGFGGLLSQHIGSVFGADKKKQDCAHYLKPENSSSDGLMSQMGSGLCSAISKTTGLVNSVSQAAEDFQNGKGGTAPKAEAFNLSGNVTNTMLQSLGYPDDSFAKDLLLSIFGMAIYVPAEQDCSRITAQVRGSPNLPNDGSVSYLRATASDTAGGPAVVEATSKSSAEGVAVEGSATEGPTGAVTAIAATKAPASATGTTQGSQACLLPPLMPDLKDAGLFFICGVNFKADYEHFQAKHGVSANHRDALWAMCTNAATAKSTSAQVAAYDRLASYPMYSCADKLCMTPVVTSMSAMSTRMSAGASDLELGVTTAYTGLGLTVMDALFRGVTAVRNPNATLPADTLAILNSADYPLYRLMNIAAVYPGMADDLLMAYGAAISVTQTFDMLTKMARPGGSRVDIHVTGLRRQNANPDQITNLRKSISELIYVAGTFHTDIFKSLAVKQELIQRLVDINKAMQAEVVSTGMSGNADLATTIKAQMTRNTSNP